MARLIFATLLLFTAAVAIADDEVPARACPVLAQGAAWSWQYREGPDFHVCYGRPAASPHSARRPLVGVYVGFHPDFHPQAPVRHGRLGGQVVAWQRKKLDPGSGLLGLETRLSLPSARSLPPLTQVHVWVLAADEATLNALLRQLERASLADIRF